MTKQFTNIVVRQFPYWSRGEDLPKARAHFKKLSGRFPTNKASIVAFTGTQMQLDEITVDDMGTINYHKDLIRTVIQ